MRGHARQSRAALRVPRERVPSVIFTSRYTAQVKRGTAHAHIKGLIKTRGPAACAPVVTITHVLPSRARVGRARAYAAPGQTVEPGADFLSGHAHATAGGERSPSADSGRV